MARTFIRQVVQIRHSESYDDTVAAGSTLESAPTNIEDDLNGLRSQVKRFNWADSAGNWYDDVQTVNGKKRGIVGLNTDLDDLEIKPLLFRSEVLTDVTVPASQDYVVLSVASSETPTQTAAVGNVNTEGAVVAFHTGTFGTQHALDEVPGANAIKPNNLLVIRNASTSEPIISSNGKEIYGLLQSEVNTNGHTFNDTTQQVQISFVEENAAGNDLVATAVADIENKSINYAYVRQVHFDNIPKYAFLTGAFLDEVASSDVTLDRAIDNQGTVPATQVTNTRWQIADGVALDFEDSAGTRDLLKIAPGAGGDEIELNVDTLDINNALDADFLNGAAFDTGGSTINVGVTAGQVDSSALTVRSTVGDLTLSTAAEFAFVDGNKAGSTYGGQLKLTDAAAEWSAYETEFGEVSLLNAIVQAARQENRTKGVAVVTSALITADTNVTGAGGSPNIDAQLPDFSHVTFLTDVDVYLNGVLLRNGTNAAANNDVYPGDSAANGDLKFEFSLKLNDVLSCVVWGENLTI